MLSCVRSCCYWLSFPVELSLGKSLRPNHLILVLISATNLFQSCIPTGFFIMSGSSKNRVKVFVRFRPTSNFAHDSISFPSDGQTINIHAKKNDRFKFVNNQLLDWSFKVDGILHNASQDQVYDTVVSEMADKAMQGYNGTLMAYGQTGAGKTFTITGATENYKQRGVIPRAISHIFRTIDEQNDKSVTVRISYLEIYNESMFDLLSTLPESSTSSQGYSETMSIVEGSDGSVSVKGLSLHTANNEGEALNLLFEGETNRMIASHSLNKNSSRSHCIFTVHIESRSRTESNAKYITSKLNLVDLAGSERIGKTGSEGQLQREAVYINKSLTFLEQTVIALADKNRSHVPFRQTKLTHALKDSIGGRCCTTLIANAYGEAEQLDETVSTLRFGLRMMRVAVEPAVNDHYNPWLLVREMEQEVKHLKQELAMHNTLANRSQINYGALTERQLADVKKQVRLFLEGKSSELDVDNLRHVNAVFAQFRSVVVEMERDMSEQFKRKYVLLDRSDSEMMVVLQKAGMPVDDEGHLVGVGEGPVASTSATIAAQPATQPAGKTTKPSVSSPKRRSGKKSRGGGSPTSRAPATPSPPMQSEASTKPTKTLAAPPAASIPAEAAESGRRESISGDSATEEKKQSRPSTPPTRSQAFEDFKKEQGQEISRILNENKTILLSKKQIVRDLAHAVNATKHMIDGARTALERKKNERLEQGEFVNEEGDTVIDEEEFQLIKQLKNLKQTYRNDYDELRRVKSEVEYCQKLVEQCRQRLVQEFDAWYGESFLQDQTDTSALAGYGSRPGVDVPSRLQVIDDEQKLEPTQHEITTEAQEWSAFHHAKLRSRNRHSFDRAMAQPQLVRKQVPGIPQVSTRNKPPKQLSYAY